MMQSTNPSGSHETVRLGEDRVVNRIGLGAMRITGPGGWGPPSDRENALTLLRRAVDMGINFIDTSDAYGPETSELLIARALYPYADNLIIATKGGYERPERGRWIANGRPEHLHEAVEESLKRLRLECFDLYLLHAPDPYVPFEESIGELARLREAGKIRSVGLSNVDVEQLGIAQKIVPIVAIENRYHVLNRIYEGLVDICEQENIVFLPWAPLASGYLAGEENILSLMAQRYQVTPAQVALSWLLRRSPNLLPIPGTCNIQHLEENLASSSIVLSDEAYQELSQLSTY
jgi:aryl-alcohol dehydrogenase-like predicted oxidoreductase